jgi:hypothetical protein
LNKNDEHGWITAINASKGLLLGYLWSIAEYPWLNLWLMVQNHEPEARGLEFGTTGLHQPWSVIMARGSIFDEPIYQTIAVGDTITKSYLMFLAPIPDDFKGVENVEFANDKISIFEYGLDPARTIILALQDGITSVEDQDGQSQIPRAVSLSQNYPNPFNGETVIKYYIPGKKSVKIEIYDLRGQKIDTLVNEEQNAGYHSVSFNADGLSSGIYLYRLQTDNYRGVTKKLIYVK